MNVAEVAGLNPEGAAVFPRDGAKPPARGKPQPGLRREPFVAFGKSAIEHQKFAAAREIEHNWGVWPPAFHPHLLSAVVEERGYFNTGPALRVRINQRMSVAPHWCAILWIELP